MKLEELSQLDNIAPKLDEQKLTMIASEAWRGYDLDKRSRAKWDEITQKGLEIARQDFERSQLGKSKIKFPAITIAAMNFASRAYPEIIRNSKVVNATFVGRDIDGSKEQRAKRVSDFMSWQLLVQDLNWEPSFDKLLHILPVIGTVFKKVYYDPINKINRSELCLPDDIFVNNNITSLDVARRITHRIKLYLNQVIENIRNGVFSDILDEIMMVADDPEDPDGLHSFLEQHTYLDLDDDGYKEPYIVTIHEKTLKVARIVACYDYEKIQYKENGDIKTIPRVEYFIDYHFIPSPDGKYYSLGFGQLLYPLNDGINTLVNQLIDAGTRNNLQSGFLGRGFRGNPGELRFQPGEWKKIDVTGDDIAKNVYPLPVKEPSPVLFQLLGLIIQVVREVSSVSDILQGQASVTEAQNVPATTVLALIEQGLKLYSSLQRRLFRSLTKEFVALYRLNAIYLDDEFYFKRQGIETVVAKEDFTTQDVTVHPVSDPSLSSDAQRMARAQALLMLSSDPTLAPEAKMAILANYLDSLQVPDALSAKILVPPKPNPDPKILELQLEAMKAEDESKTNELDRQLKANEAYKDSILAELEAYEKIANIRKTEAEALANLAKAEATESDNDLKTYSTFLDSIDLITKNFQTRIKDLESQKNQNLPPEMKQFIEPKEVENNVNPGNAESMEPTGSNEGSPEPIEPQNQGNY